MIKITMEGETVPNGFSIKIPSGESRLSHAWATLVFKLGKRGWGYRICNHRNNYFYQWVDTKGKDTID